MDGRAERQKGTAESIRSKLKQKLLNVLDQKDRNGFM
jgi:hypothetical protein